MGSEQGRDGWADGREQGAKWGEREPETDEMGSGEEKALAPRIGIWGLGRMGANMARRLSRAGLRVAVHNRTFEVAGALAAEEETIVAAKDLSELLGDEEGGAVVWMMLPSGEATRKAFHEILPLLGREDILVDGANEHYEEARRKNEILRARGVGFCDAGVSGGVWGLERGYCTMVGGEERDVERLEPFLRALAPEGGWARVGPAGAGHFAKMVHNGIEYGMMQSLAEGFAMLQAKDSMGFDVGRVAELWRHGSVIESWLLDLSAKFLASPEDFEGVSPKVSDSGEGRWMAKEAIDMGLPAPALMAAMGARFGSQGGGDFALKALALMRKGFGGHAVAKSGE